MDGKPLGGPPLRDEPASAAIDTTRASIARVYDAALDGKDNYRVDRDLLAQVLEVTPGAALVAKALRRWLLRVTRYLVNEVGVDQFLDCGAGLPTVENTHQSVQRHNPEATVVYLDNDPIVLAHGRALLEDNSNTHFLAADLTKPAEVLHESAARRHLDFGRPLALIMCATLHHVDDDARPVEIMAEYIDALPAGSFVALTHWWDPEDGGEGTELARAVETTYRTSSMGTGRYRTREEIAAMLPGLELVEPGLVEIEQWWPDGPALTPLSLVERLILGAVGRKR